MITIIHGHNHLASRQALDSLKMPLKIDAKSISQEDLSQTLESNSLFNNHTSPIIIENLLTLRPSKNKQKLIKIVLNNQQKDIYLWHIKSLTKTALKPFKKAQIKEFKLTKYLFKFLDAFKPQNQISLLKLFHQALKTDPAELIFYWLHRRTSQLIQALSDPKELRGVPWQINKLNSQARSFDLNTLLKLHQKLLGIDYQIKTGQTKLNLNTQLDLLLLKI